MSLLVNRRAMMAPPTDNDPWQALIAAIAAGSYRTKYAIGDIIPLPVGDASVDMEIVAFDADTLANDATQTAAVTLISKHVPFLRRVNSGGLNGIGATDAQQYNTGLAGWPSTELRYWLRETYMQQFPAHVCSAIKEVNKTYYEGYSEKQTLAIADTIWIPSMREVNVTQASTVKEATGPIYSYIFSATDNATRVKRYNSQGSRWWLRGTNYNPDTGRWPQIGDGGAMMSLMGATGSGNTSIGVVFGFCL